MEFTTYRFKDCIAEIIDNRGRNPDKYYDSEKYPVIDNYLIKNELHPVVENANRFLSQSQFDNFLRGYVTKDDLLMTLVGNGIGNVSLSPNDKIAIVQNTVGFRLNQELLDSHFAFYYFKTINSAVRNLDRGASQPSVNRTDVLRLKIQVPTINTQKQIADILSTYDELIENNNKRIKLLEQMAENLYKEWFVRFRFPGYETAEFENGLPKGWNIKRLADYGRVETGKTPSTEIADNYGEEYMFVKTPDMHCNIFTIQTSEYLSQRGHSTQPKKLLPQNSIMVSCIGTGGVVSINAKPAHTNQQINSIILHDLDLLDWLFFTCKSLKETILLFGVTGATMTNLSKGKFEKLKVIAPSEDLILKFHDKVHPMFEQIKSLMNQNQNLIKQRDLLLPRLMSGKLEV